MLLWVTMVGQWCADLGEWKKDDSRLEDEGAAAKMRDCGGRGTIVRCV